MGLIHSGPPASLVLRLKNAYHLHDFVETGTYSGRTAVWAASHFDNVITVENSRDIFEKTVSRYGLTPNIKFILGDSRLVLKTIVHELARPAIFWLDAHWSGGQTYGENDECPLLEEISLVMGSTQAHFLLIDDARLLTCPPPSPHRAEQWPSIDRVVEALRSGRNHYYVAIIEDVIIAVPEFAQEAVVGYGQEVSAREWEKRSIDQPRSDNLVKIAKGRTDNGCACEATKVHQTASEIRCLSNDSNTLDQLKALGIWSEGQPLRFHLGCGEQYLNGYINIDYPPSEHNVMHLKADLYADIRQLQFPTGWVDEIRLHHVFEHFNRVTALEMLIKWHDWLKVGGILRIETPDLMGSAKTLVSDAAWHIKMGAVRHLVGDQAAAWAYHLDYWFPERFERTLKLLGFREVQTRSSAWEHEPYLSNVEVIAFKSGRRPLEVQLRMAEELLRESTVSPAERPIHQTWTAQLRAALSGAAPSAPSNAQTLIKDPLMLALAALARNGSSLPLDEIHDFNQRARDRWIAAKARAVSAGARVLDLGAGTCPYRPLFSHCEYKTHDFKQYMGNEKLGGVSEYGHIDYISDITAIPVPDHSFDVIICTEALEHVPEPIEVLREISRILRPGGRAFITAPLGSGLHQLPYHFYGGYTPEWYRHFCPRFGMEVSEVVPNGGFFKLLAQECARVAGTWLQHQHLHGSESEPLRHLFGELLPRYLFALDDKCFMDKFTVGYHVEAVRVGQDRSSELAQTALATAARSQTDHLQTVGVVFSKDRAFQLDGTLRSLLLHCQDCDEVALKVLYRASDDTHQRQYQQLAAAYAFVEFIPERTFKVDLLSSIGGAQYVLFLVDDNIFVSDFRLNEVAEQLKAHPETLGFSLRLGKNTTYCYPLDATQQLPEFQTTARSIRIYDWTVAEHDFGYPLEVSSSVYRTQEMLPLLEQLDFTNPNTLEAQLAAQAPSFRANRNRLLCYEQSVTLCAPINMVQTVCRNRVGSKSKYSTEKLARLFDEGYRLKAEAYSDFISYACHQEIDLTLQQIEETWPMVSVIIPCYNQAQYLPEAVESVVNQTFHQWECIIVNDGSSDQTSQVARGLIARYPDKRIRLLEKANGGLADARNAGIAASHGRYILPLDADDLLGPYALTQLVEVLEGQVDVAIAYSDYEIFGVQSGVARCIDENLFLNPARPENGLPYCSLYRREVWSAVGGYNPNMIWGYEDWDFWIGCVEKGFSARRVPEPLFLYRVKSDSMYTNALKHDAELRAQIVFNHPTLYNEATRRWAESVLEGRTGSELSVEKTSPTDILPPDTAAVNAHLQRADERFVAGDLPAARDALLDAIALAPGDLQLIIAYGNILLRLGDTEAAQREFVKATKLAPDDAAGYLNLAAVLLMLGQAQEAEASVRRALALNPTDVDAIKLLGRLCLESGRSAEGVEAYAGALRQNPTDVETLLMLGKCAVEASDLNTAQAMYERALEVDPNNQVARENLSIVRDQVSTNAVEDKAPAFQSAPHVHENMHSTRAEIQQGIPQSVPMARSASASGPPLVSVIVPTFNRPEMLVEALNSILNQTFRDFEIVVVNDGGPDSENIVTGLNRDSRITYIRHGKNRGLAAARNTGIGTARGKYIAYLDDDDLYYPEHLETLVTFLESSDHKVAYTDAYRAFQVKEGGQYIVKKRDVPYSFEFNCDRILVENFVPVLCFMHERSCLDQAGVFNETLTTHEDWDLWIRISKRFQPAHLKRITCEFRVRTDGSTMSSSKLADFLRTYEIIIEKYQEFTKNRPDIREAQQRVIQARRRHLAQISSAAHAPDIVAVSAHLRKVEELFAHGDLTAARNSLLDALVLTPGDPQLIVALGNMNLRLGEIDAARREFTKATVLHPQYAPAHADLAAMLLHLGRAEEAEASARRALALNPADTGSLKVLARVCLDSERYTEAVQAYVAILRTNPDDLETLLVVGNCYAEAGRPEDAKTFYQRVIQLDPHNTVAAENLAIVNGSVAGSDGLLEITQAGDTQSYAMRDPSLLKNLTSIIILTHNGLEHTEKCLASIETCTPEPHELIIVDNSSSDGTLDYLRNYMAAHDNVRVIANRINRGFAAGNNQGLALAQGEYVLLLNNDTVVTKGWLKRMLEVFEQHPEVGIVGPMSNYVSGPQLVRDASYKDPEGLEAFAAAWARGHDGQSGEATRVVGFCLLMRKEVIARIGGLDEQFGSGNFEDDDFCIRALQVGFLARIALDVFIHHAGSQTFKAAKIDYRQSLMRNWELFKCKWGIPSDAPYEKGYHFPPQPAPGLPMSIPLPDVSADHRCEVEGRWWQEVGAVPSGRPDSGLPPGTGQPRGVAPTASLPAIILANGHGLIPLWPSLVQHTSHPLAVTMVASVGNGNGSATEPQPACPDGWQIRTADVPHVRLLNELLESAHDDQVILLSADLVLTPGWLKRLLAALDRDPRIAIVGPTINHGSVSQQVKADYKGIGKALRQFALRRSHRYARQLADASTISPYCLVFNTAVCRQIGPLRDDLDLSDALKDYCARATQGGYRAAVALDVYVHREVTTSDERIRLQESATVKTDEAVRSGRGRIR